MFSRLVGCWDVGMLGCDVHRSEHFGQSVYSFAWKTCKSLSKKPKTKSMSKSYAQNARIHKPHISYHPSIAACYCCCCFCWWCVFRSFYVTFSDSDSNTQRTKKNHPKNFIQFCIYIVCDVREADKFLRPTFFVCDWNVSWVRFFGMLFCAVLA